LLKADLLAAEQAVGQAGVLLDRATEASREIEGAAETPTRGLRLTGNSRTTAEWLERRDDLRRLRPQLTELEELTRSLEHTAQEARSTSIGAGTYASGQRRMAVAAAALAALVLGVVAYVLVGRREAGLGAITAIVAIALAALTISLARSDREGSEPRTLSDAKSDAATYSALETVTASAVAGRLESLAALSARVDKSAAALGLTVPPTRSEVEQELGESEDGFESSRAADEIERARARGVLEIEEAERRLSCETRRAQSAQAEVDAFASRHGLRSGIGIENLDRTIDELASYRARRQDLQRLERDIAKREAEIVAFDRALGEALTTLGVEAPGDEVPGASVKELLDQLASRLSSVNERETERSRLEQEVRRAASELDRSLGSKDVSRRLREELELGRVVEWEVQGPHLETELATTQLAYEEAVREHARLKQELDEISRSSDVPKHEQECAELEDELDTVLLEYLVASSARWLLQRTLKKYEEERQPAVLDRATRHFEAVTRGRYRRLLVDSGGEGPRASETIRVVTSSGSSLEAAALS
ncbi:MAG: ATP-binding protein, partial [Acidimicrobiales bacterium]